MIPEKYCDKCGIESRKLREVSGGKKLCPVCRGIPEERQLSRLEKVKRDWE